MQIHYGTNRWTVRIPTLELELEIGYHERQCQPDEADSHMRWRFKISGYWCLGCSSWTCWDSKTRAEMIKIIVLLRSCQNNPSFPFPSFLSLSTLPSPFYTHHSSPLYISLSFPFLTFPSTSAHSSSTWENEEVFIG